MGRLKVHEFTSLDGVVEDPSWTAGFGFPDDLGDAVDGILGSCRAILLGRATYELFAEGWSDRTVEDDPGAPFFNDTPKHVVSSTLTDPPWGPVSVLDGYDPAAVRALVAGTDGDVYVAGSAQLVRALVADGLVDELHLFVYPVVLGAGRRLFDESGPATRLSLRGVGAFSNGVAHLAHGPASA